MPLDVQITDEGHAAAVSDDRSVVVAQSPNVAIASQRMRPFVSFLTTTAGASQMSGVVGTLAAPVDFRVGVPTTIVADRYISQLGFVITGNAGTLAEFGTGAALTNGCQLLWTSDKFGTVQIGGNLKSNFDFVRLAQGQPSFGDAGNAFRASTVISVEEGFLPVVDFRRFMSPSPGLQLAAGSNQRLTLRIRDTIVAGSVPNFDALAYGFDRLHPGS